MGCPKTPKVVKLSEVSEADADNDHNGRRRGGPTTVTVAPPVTWHSPECLGRPILAMVATSHGQPGTCWVLPGVLLVA